MITITALFLKYKKILMYIGIAIFILFLILSIKSCFTKEVKIDEENISKINSENKLIREEELKKVVEKNSDIIKTVDERNVLVSESIETRDIEINKKIQEVDDKIQTIKLQKGDVTSEELKCILIPENCS